LMKMEKRSWSKSLQEKKIANRKKTERHRGNGTSHLTPGAEGVTVPYFHIPKGEKGGFTTKRLGKRVLIYRRRIFGFQSDVIHGGERWRLKQRVKGNFTVLIPNRSARVKKVVANNLIGSGRGTMWSRAGTGKLRAQP